MSQEIKKSKGLNITLWMAQILMAALFLMAGVTKFTSSIEEQRSKMEWVKHVSGGLNHFVGIVEIIGALSLLLPSILKIKPQLTPLAALGLSIVMVLAIALNLSIGESSAIGLLIIFAPLLFIAWGRFKKVPILPKS